MRTESLKPPDHAKATALYIYAAVRSSACKKDDTNPAPLVVYTIEVEGNQVSFNNTTTGATSWKWDFGDGTNSSEQSPVHTYRGKGKYVPTLYATSAAGLPRRDLP